MSEQISDLAETDLDDQSIKTWTLDPAQTHDLWLGYAVNTVF